MYKKSLVLIGFLAAVLCGVSCRHTPVVPDSPVVSFQNDVLPIFGGNCSSSRCHGGGEGRPLDSYTSVMSHNRIVPGDIYNSRIFQKITSRSGDIMPRPPQAPLTDHQIGVIEVWILQGAQNN